MTEEFLHYIWKHGLFDHDNLMTSNGKLLKIINLGWLNTDSGPDFFNAKILIEDTIWAGNIEIHVNSSDWKKHNHSGDKTYDNVILHVVLNSDDKIFRKNGEIIPEISLKNRFRGHLFNKYRNFIENQLWVPCENIVSEVDYIVIESWLERMLFEKLEKMTSVIKALLEKNKYDWNAAFYLILARNFGFKLNSDAFENLANSLPISILMKHLDNPFQVEALLFGQSGLIGETFGDQYPKELYEEYKFLKHKYSLNPIESHLWKFMRLRPTGFPTIRISQFGKLIIKSPNLFSTIIEINDINKVLSLFAVAASEYWNRHFVFDKETMDSKEKYLGIHSINLLLINTVVPFIFTYGDVNNQQWLKDRAVSFLLKIDAEENAILRKWEKAGLKAESAFHSQALIELKNCYCDSKKCLNCGIGNFLLNRNLK
ncbi:MAG: DUF2851 family protein [Bacteroidetes bacterium]|nr:DUF2851 family protein [Bacteroidota bacterium]